MNVPDFTVKGPADEIFSLDQLCDIINFGLNAPKANDNIGPVATNAFVSAL